MKWRRTFASTIALCLLCCSVIHAQITVTPAQAPVGTKVVATVSATVPEGVTFEGGWSVSCAAGQCQAELADLKEPHSVGIWSPVPGQYTLTYSGFWLLLKEVSFKDGDGNTVTITSYLGHGFINERAEFFLEGENGPDPPGPNPTPDGPYKIWFAETGDRTTLPKGQRDLLSSLVYRERLEALGHDYQETLFPNIIDSPPARLSAVSQAVREAQLSYPVVVLEPLGGGDVEVIAMPADYEALARLLEGEQ